jgi:hypothetical protein
MRKKVDCLYFSLLVIFNGDETTTTTTSANDEDYVLISFGLILEQAGTNWKTAARWEIQHPFDLHLLLILLGYNFIIVGPTRLLNDQLDAHLHV